MTRLVSNPPNPWSSRHVELLGEPPPAALQVYEEEAKSLVTENDSPDVDYRFGVNPYRGCFHGCAYCYARPSHQFLGWGAGTDFERRIVVKTNAAALLERHFAKKSWTGELVCFSGVTDAYQPLEASYGITRACLEVCRAHRQPVAVVTKGALVRRDADLLGALAREAFARVEVSVPFADAELAAAIEPAVAPPAIRLDAIRVLAEAGVSVGVSVSPVIPGLNDAQIPAILEAARQAGAERAWMILLRLPDEVAPVFEERLREAVPLRADKVLSAVREMRGGELYRGGFGRRMEGAGPRWQAIASVFETTCRKLGMSMGRPETKTSTFRRPDPQGRLFGS